MMTSRKHLTRWPLFLFASTLLVSAANATASMHCGGIDSDVEVDILFGAGPVLSIIDVSLSTGEQYFSTQNREGATPAAIARAFADLETVKIDLMDDQASELLASIRILRSPDEDAFQIGYVQIRENRPLGVTCDGP